MSTNGEWLTVKEAAKLAGYNPEHITRLIRQGKVEARKFSIVWQVNRQSILEYLDKARTLGEKRGPKSEK
jgi:excisionase family DNA binding protein